MKPFPDLTTVDFDSTPAPASLAEWQARFEHETGRPLAELVEKTL